MIKERNQKVLKFVIQLWGLFSLVFFIVSKFDNLIPFFAERDYTYGNLYDFARVSDFKISIPQKTNVKDTVTSKKPGHSEVLLLGDSYSLTEYGHPKLGVMIGNKLGKRVYVTQYEDLFLKIPDITLSLDVSECKEERVLLIESTERYIVDRFGENMSFFNPADSLSNTQPFVKSIYANFFSNGNNNYNYLIDFNKFLNKYGINEFFSTIRFKLGGIITKTTPKYSITPPMLFYYESINYYNKAVSNSQLDDVVVNLKKMQKHFKKYKIKIILVLIPERYTLYHKYINSLTGNNTIPRIQKKFEQERLDFVDIYSAFDSDPELLYWQTDTHWNIRGFEKATDLIAQKLKTN